MLNTITLKNTEWIVRAQERAKGLFMAVYKLKERYKSFFVNCAVVYMSIKVGLILLATFATMSYLISIVPQFLAIEMSRSKAILFASPMTLIIILKLYFIFKVLATYDRSRLMMKSAFNIILLKGRRGVQHLKETLPVDLAMLSPKKVQK